MRGHDGKTPTTYMTLALDWWQGARARWAQLHQLDRLSSDELDRLAQDVGMNSSDLLRILTQPDGADQLLQRRLKLLNLDPEDIRALSPLLLRDLERTCGLCGEKARCSADMADGSDPVGWESYCPNSGTLRTLT
jgi:hypothetical protein